MTFTETAAGSQTFTVDTIKDNVDEGAGETFLAYLIGIQGGGGPAPGLGTDTAPTIIIEPGFSDIILRADPDTVLESATATDITIKAIFKRRQSATHRYHGDHQPGRYGDGKHGLHG